MAGLNISEWGPAEAPVLVLLHGFMGSGADWAEVAAALPEFRVLAPDLPGHGRSTGMADEAYTLSGAIAYCAPLLGTGAPVLLAGYSMGGRVAQDILATGHLLDSTGLCLIGAHPGLQSDEDRAVRLESDRQLASQIEADFESTLGDWLRLPLFSTLTAAQRQALSARRILNCLPSELARSLRGMSTGRQLDRRSVLAHAASRVRLVVGERDERYLGLLSGLGPQLISVARAGHNVLLERPEAVAEILRDLALRQLGPRAGA